MSQSVSFLPKSQKRLSESFSYVIFKKENTHICQPIFFLQLAPSAPVLLLELKPNKALRVNFRIEKAPGKQRGAPKTTREA